MSGVKYALCGIAAVALAVLIFAPARALAPLAERVDGVAVEEISGWWWNGQANVILRGFPVGRSSWRLDPWPLFAAELRFDWRLDHADHRLVGIAGFAPGGALIVASSGEAGVDALNRALAAYHIRLGGTFRLESLSARMEDGRLAVNGTLHWSGGRTVYRLSGNRYEVELPSMVARLETNADKPMLTVRSVPDETLLLNAELDGDGWLRIGVTKRLTVLADKPWLGAAEDEDVVLGVQEKMIF